VDGHAGTARIGAGRAALLALAGAATLLAVLLALLARPGVPVAVAATDCPNATAAPSEATLKELRHSITCLINEKRRRHGLRRVDPNHKLRTGAQAHTDVMLAQDCFLHTCTDEPPLGRRIRNTGYNDGARAFQFAEDLGYESTPKQMINRWMKASFDSHNILNGKFRDIGVGVGYGAPVEGVSDADFVTYTLEFAWRD
jgi:uncharacterized protein YkwD